MRFPIVVASGYFGYVGCKWLLLVLFGFLVVAALSVLAGAGVLFWLEGTKSADDYAEQFPTDVEMTIT
jgi:hypothetical protein